MSGKRPRPKVPSRRPRRGAKSGPKQIGRKSRKVTPPTEYSVLLTVTLCLVALGALMVFSASSVKALEAAGLADSVEYLKRVAIFGALGLVAMRLAAWRGLTVAYAATPAILAVAAILLVAVLVPGIGQTVNGSQRWVGFGMIQFQPSEIAKLALLLYSARLLASEPKRVRTLKELSPLLVVGGVLAGLVALQPDLGTIGILVLSTGALMYTAGVKPRTIAPVAAVVAVGAIGLIASNPYQQERITGFINPSADADGAGYQNRQAEIAIGSGGVFGVGMGESVQKASYLPEAHTDMISAVLGEEAGLLGMTALLGLFAAFGWAGFKAAHRSRNRYAKLLGAGLTALILVQAVINLFAVMGLAPLTGVPLPFVSYGGTSLVIMLVAAGLLLNVARGGSVKIAARAPAEARTRPEPARAGGAARLRVLEGGASERIPTRRRAAASSRSGRRDRRSRDAGHRRGGRAEG